MMNGNGNGNRPNNYTNDPQIVLEGRFKKGPNSDMVTFSLMDADGLFERVFIVTIPPEGEERSPVYVKHKVNAFPKQNFLFGRVGTGDARRARRPYTRTNDDDYEEEDRDERESA